MSEPFSFSVKYDAWVRSGKRCECERILCTNHIGRCKVQLNSSSDAEYHHKDRYGPATLSNCEVLCPECHRQTRSYGAPL